MNEIHSVKEKRKSMSCKKTNMTKEHFNETANYYEDSFDGRYVKPMYDYILRYFADKKEASILDIGCGNGTILARLANERRTLYGVDLSENMIEIAKKRLGVHAKLLVADAKELPFSESEFDYIICNASFHHYPYPKETLQEMRRVLKNKGELLIGEGYAYEPFRFFLNVYFKFAKTGDIHSYGMHEMVRMLEKAGFQVKRTDNMNGRVFYLASVRK